MDKRRKAVQVIYLSAERKISLKPQDDKNQLHFLLRIISFGIGF
jgi:hypothetical protein